MKKNLLIALFALTGIVELSAMISPEDRSVPPRQGFRYSNRSILVNKYGRLVIPKKSLKKKFDENLLEDEELVLDSWLEWNDYPSNFFGGRPYGNNCKTGPKDYDDMVNDLNHAQENENQINELQAASQNEFTSWKNDLNSSHIFRDMKITEKIFGVRKEKAEASKKIQQAYLAPLNDAFNNEVELLNVSLQDTQKSLRDTNESLKKSRVELKKKPNNKNFKKTIQQLINKKNLVNQERLVKSEIKSFKNMDNRDSFYRSSMKRTDFDMFQQCRTRE